MLLLLLLLLNILTLYPLVIHQAYALSDALWNNACLVIL